MTIRHHLVGYNAATRAVKVKVPIPANKLSAALRAVELNRGDEEAFDSYPLAKNQVDYIAKQIGAVVDSDDALFFLEASADISTVRARIKARTAA